MKKVFIFLSIVFLFSISLTGCDKKEKACNKFYNRLVTCTEDLGVENKININSKKNFIRFCKNNYDEDAIQQMLKCVPGKTCKSFFRCISGIEQPKYRKRFKKFKKFKKPKRSKNRSF